MKSFYINLDSAVKRRADLEANFAKYRKSGWSLARVPAVDARFVEANHVKGKLRPNEKACFLSHVQLIRDNLKGSDPILVLEDDAIFGKQSCDVIEKTLRSHSQSDWDIIFTDVFITQVQNMVDLIAMRRQLAQSDRRRADDAGRVREETLRHGGSIVHHHGNPHRSIEPWRGARFIMIASQGTAAS